jgi:hypothetical protein
MQEKHLYEYAVIRVVLGRTRIPQCGYYSFFVAKFIKVLYSVNGKLNFFRWFGCRQLHLNVQAFAKVAHGENQADQ